MLPAGLCLLRDRVPLRWHLTEAYVRNCHSKHCSVVSSVVRGREML